MTLPEMSLFSGYGGFTLGLKLAGIPAICGKRIVNNRQLKQTACVWSRSI